MRRAANRRKFIAGNWKMNGFGEEAIELGREIRVRLQDVDGVDIAVCPPFTILQAVGAQFAESRIRLGAQDMFWKESGAYTGKVSGPMLKAVGCSYVILGHSECRGRFGKTDEDITDETIRHFGDTNATVHLKVKAAFRHGILPIVCVGETLAERESGSTDQIVEVQARAALHELSPDQIALATIAYEPVWAIGTGKTCDCAEANRVCGVIRHVIGRMTNASTARDVRIQYGGSVNAENAAEILAQPEIDGALVGGQSLKPEAFAQIVFAGVRD